MKQPTAIPVLQYWSTILVIPVFYQYLPVSAILVQILEFYLIFQYLQYWNNQYFPESSSICNTGITRIFQNLPVSAILVLPVFPRIYYTKRIEYNSYSYVISAVHNIRGKSPVMSKYFVWSLRV
jgi:hypothetical protein